MEGEEGLRERAEAGKGERGGRGRGKAVRGSGRKECECRGRGAKRGGVGRGPTGGASHTLLPTHTFCFKAPSSNPDTKCPLTQVAGPLWAGHPLIYERNGKRARGAPIPGPGFFT